MAKYELTETTATLVLDEGPYAGAEVEANVTVGMGVYLAMMRTGAAMISVGDPGKADEAERAFQLFAQHGLRGWNLTRNGQPVPANLEGLLSITPDMAAEILAVWVAAIGGGAAAPLPTPRHGSTASSSNGASRRRSSTARTRRGS